MKKRTLKLELPTAEQLCEGLTLHEVHPPLGDAEAAVRDTAEMLATARTELAAVTVEAEETLPAAVHAGTRPAADLDDALRRQRAAALAIAPAEEAVLEAKEALYREKQEAKLALSAAVTARGEVLHDAVAVLAPVCEEVRDLERALARMAPRRRQGVGLRWPRLKPGPDTER